MTSIYTDLRTTLRNTPKTWLITGVAGFIGSNLLEELLLLGQNVVGLDNFSTGKPENLHAVQEAVGSDAWQKFRFDQADIRDISACHAACAGVEYVLHQAALGSVPRSIEDPILTNQSNIDGFVNMLVAARDAKVRRFVYAASSSTYGDHPGLPKVEDRIGRPLSPYAVTKYVNELYADVFSRCYGMETIGLRYFNVFGKRQDPNGAYAAVIPKWINKLLHHEVPTINGDGETSRDFCYIDNVVQANLLSAAGQEAGAANRVYNIAFGERTTLNELFRSIQTGLSAFVPGIVRIMPQYGPERAGDVRHSLADIGLAGKYLHYAPQVGVAQGMQLTVRWYVDEYGGKDSK